MGITNSNKVLSTGQIDCGETLKVTLALTAAPDTLSNPVDIALVLDRSGSMAGAPLANMKAGGRRPLLISSRSPPVGSRRERSARGAASALSASRTPPCRTPS